MSSLRAFKAYNNTAPVSPSVAMDPTWTKTKQLLQPCSIVDFDGFVAGPGYLQIFDSLTAPVNTNVPLMSIRVEDDGSGGVMPLPSFLPSLGPIQVKNGLYFAYSSTGPTYTALATAFSIWGAVDEFERNQPDTLSVAGDTSTGITHLQVWAEATGRKKLTRLELTDVSGITGTRYLQLFAKDAPTDLTEKPIFQWPVVAATNYVYEFGIDGLDVFSQDLNSSTARKGCTLWLSSTAGVLTKSTDTIAMKGYYK